MSVYGFAGNTSLGPAIEGGRFLQFNCKGIQDCFAELQDFHHNHQVLVACVLDPKLGVNSTLNEFTVYATISRDRPTGGGGGGLAALVHHSVPYGVTECDIFPNDDMAEALAVETGLGAVHTDLGQCLYPPSSSCPRNYAPNFDILLEDHGDQMVLGVLNAQHPCAPPLPSCCGLPDGTLQLLICQSWHPSNLEKFSHNPKFDGRED